MPGGLDCSVSKIWQLRCTNQESPSRVHHGLLPLSSSPSKQGTLALFWSNKTENVNCSETAGADVEYRLPELLPYQTHSFTVKLPYTSAAITPNATTDLHFFIDST
jgi:hypothetical protein